MAASSHPKHSAIQPIISVVSARKRAAIARALRGVGSGPEALKVSVARLFGETD